MYNTLVPCEFDPSIQETLEIILERYDMSLSDKISELRDNQEALQGVLDAFSLAVDKRKQG